MKRLYAIRGAVCSENTKESICENTVQMCRKIFLENNIKSEDLVSIQFTMTPDLDQINPATALRRGDVGIDVTKPALFCSQEAVVQNMLPRVIRVMVSVYLEEGTDVVNAYLNGAEVLRPDYVKQ